MSMWVFNHQIVNVDKKYTYRRLNVDTFWVKILMVAIVLLQFHRARVSKQCILFGNNYFFL